MIKYYYSDTLHSVNRYERAKKEAEKEAEKQSRKEKNDKNRQK